MEDMKTCGRCKQTKPLDEFGANKRNPDGLNRYCKECAREQLRESYRRIKDRESECRPKDRGGVGDPELSRFTDRRLLAELKCRGFVWGDMKRVVTVKYDKI